jgi:hypothetical protein
VAQVGPDDDRHPQPERAGPRVFSDRAGLCGALLSVWEATSALGMTGGHLRELYATFLPDVAPMLGLTVDEVNVELDRAAGLWARLGAVAIGDDPALARLRDPTVTIRQTPAAEGDAGAGGAASAGGELWDLRRHSTPTAR